MMFRDLIVLVLKPLKANMQVQQAIKKVNGLFTFIMRVFECRSKEILLQLPRATVRSDIEYCVQS